MHCSTLQHFERFHEAVRFFRRAIDLQVNVRIVYMMLCMYMYVAI